MENNTFISPINKHLVTRNPSSLQHSFPGCLRGPRLRVIVKISDTKSEGSRNPERAEQWIPWENMGSRAVDWTLRGKRHRGGRREKKKEHTGHMRVERGDEFPGVRVSTASSLGPSHGRLGNATGPTPRECGSAPDPWHKAKIPIKWAQ